MGQMHRRDHVSIIDFNGDEFRDDQEKHYCKHCKEYGFLVRLNNRIYPEGEPIPPDHENWLQCHECGLIVPVYEVSKESEIKDVVETIENPFDLAKDQFLGIDSRKLRKKRRQKDKLEYINDDDLKRESKKGSTLISYSESMQ